MVVNDKGDGGGSGEGGGLAAACVRTSMTRVEHACVQFIYFGRVTWYDEIEYILQLLTVQYA